MKSVSESRERQVDGQAAVRPASDDSVPLREYLEKLLDDLRVHFDAAIVAQATRFDDLRAADKTALDAAFASADKAVQTAFTSQATAVRIALEGQKAESVRSDAAMEKRYDGLNELRKDVAMSAEVRAVRDTVAVELRALGDKLADVKSRQDKMEASDSGRSSGLKDYIAWIVAAITIVSSVIGFAILLRK